MRDALATTKANWDIINDSLDAIEEGADTLRAISTATGSHYSTIGRHLRTAGLPAVQDLATMTPKKRAQLRREAREEYERALAAEEKRKESSAERERLNAIPTLAEMREGYLKRKEAGSRAVVCRECGARGSANQRVVGKRGPVICGECRTRLGLWK